MSKEIVIDGSMLKRMFLNAANTLDNNKELVDSLNVFPVPDGDTGTNMSLTMFSAVQELNILKREQVCDVVEAVANGSLMGARGNSGVILSQLFRGFASKLKRNKKMNTEDFALGLGEGVETAYRAVMKPTEGTILTVAREGADRAKEISGSVKNFDEFLDEIIKCCASTLERTPEMLDVLAQAGVVDAGGKGFVFILIGFLEALRGEEITLKDQGRYVPVITEETTADMTEDTDLEFPYCTEFVIKNPKGDAEQLKKAYSTLGDCTLVVGDSNVIKVHIHTNRPGKVLEEGLRLGELSRIKIENMKEQHRSTIEKEIKQKEFGFISVAMGDGFVEIFKSLGVDSIIQGGQTMNPSTHDILKAVDGLWAKNIFILPNNGNIILSANQAKELSDKNIFVIPSRSMPQGITAMIAFNSTCSAEENFDDMKAIIETVKTGHITYAVRDSTFNGIVMQEGDIIGIVKDEIRAKGKDIEQVAFELVSSLKTVESDVITIFYGKEITKERATDFASRLQREMEDYEIDIHYGGQPVYYYIISVE